MPSAAGLFIIIALGESILVTGATFARLDWAPVAAAAFVLAFTGSIAMWWIYFNIGAERGSKHISRSSDPGRVGRIAYTYLHLPIVGGIILAAVGDELVLAHPLGHVELNTVIAVVGGPALYVAGNLLFKQTITDRWPLSHLIGLALLALAVLVSPILSPLVLSFLAAAALIVVAIWETTASPKGPAKA